jgi:hypothetical protein
MCFQFFNYFSYFFYIAFWLQDMERLHDALLDWMIVKTIVWQVPHAWGKNHGLVQQTWICVCFFLYHGPPICDIEFRNFRSDAKHTHRSWSSP